MEWLLKPEAPFLFLERLLPDNCSPVGEYVANLESGQICTYRLRGCKMTNKGALLDEISGAMEFPNYFGKNWSAFEDCLLDLSWIGCPACILFIDEPEVLLHDAPEEDLLTFLEILRDVGSYWAKPIDDIEGAVQLMAFHTVLRTKIDPDFLPGRLSEALRVVGAKEI